MTKTVLGIVLLSVMLLISAGAHAADRVNASLFGKLAVEGHDVVAYFKEKQAVLGSKEFSHTWRGVHWRFKSEKNRKRFIADPEGYAPQYGGYCAWAVAHGYTADIDPGAFRIVKGKLYLNYSQKIRKQWNEDTEKYIRDGDANWARMRRQ